MKRPSRKVVALGVVVVVAGAGAGVALTGDDGGSTPSAAATSTAKVEQRDLVVTDSYDGQLGYGAARSYATDRAGVVTTVAASGTSVAVGSSLFSIDFEPTVVLAGAVPAYRALDSSSNDGPDVKQLEEGLVALGHGDGVTVDDHFDSGTAAAVKRWETALGRSAPDGTVELGDVAFAGGPVRVGTITSDVGTRVQQGSTVLEATPTAHVVTVDVAAAKSNEVEPGLEVAITLPDRTETTGAVSAIGSPVAAQDQGGPNGGGTTVPITITLTDPTVAEAFDTGAVAVAVERKREDGAVAVPVEALLALVEGGYAVELAATHQLVGVEVGTFAGGWVGVTGSGVDPGVDVVVPA